MRAESFNEVFHSCDLMGKVITKVENAQPHMHKELRQIL